MCGKAFYQNGNFKEHEKIHQGEAPYGKYGKNKGDNQRKSSVSDSESDNSFIVDSPSENEGDFPENEVPISIRLKQTAFVRLKNMQLNKVLIRNNTRKAQTVDVLKKDDKPLCEKLMVSNEIEMPAIEKYPKFDHNDKENDENAPNLVIDIDNLSETSTKSADFQNDDESAIDFGVILEKVEEDCNKGTKGENPQTDDENVHVTTNMNNCQRTPDTETKYLCPVEGCGTTLNTCDLKSGLAAQHMIAHNIRPLKMAKLGLKWKKIEEC